MKYILEDIIFKINKKNCEYETMKYCLDYSYENYYTSAELFLLTGGLEFEFLKGSRTLGYNSLKIKGELLHKYITSYIEWHKPKTMIQKINLIENALQHQAPVTLYIKAEGLIYQHFSEKRYPYHIINVYGIDTDLKEIYIADLFVNDEKNMRTMIGKFPWYIILENTLEIIVYNRKKCLVLKNNHEDIIIENMKKFLVDKIPLINSYFIELNTVSDLYYKINSITSTRWLFIPMFEFINEYARDTLDKNTRIAVIQLIEKWKNMMLKYIKFCYIDIKMDIYSKLDIFSMLNDTREVIENVIRNLEE